MTYRFWGIVCISIGLLAFLFQGYTQSVPTTAKEYLVRDFHLFAVEHKSHWQGKEVETYRWDPGSLILKKGQPVRLHLHGFNGNQHSFTIPKMKIQGTVLKGKVTSVEFTPEEEGTFELICLNHGNIEENGPMIAYLTVVD